MAKKDVSAIVSGMGASASIIQLLVDKARSRGVPDEVIHSLATPQGENLLDKFVELLAAVVGFFRKTGEFTIRVPALPRPTLARLQGQHSWIKSIERDNSPTETTTLSLGTVLRPDEGSVGGTKYEQRIVSLPTMGYQHAVWLVEHQDEFPEFMALLGKIYIDFPGLIVVLGNGYRRVPCLRRAGGRWCLDWHWLGSDFYSFGRVAVSSK